MIGQETWLLILSIALMGLIMPQCYYAAPVLKFRLETLPSGQKWTEFSNKMSVFGTVSSVHLLTFLFQKRQVLYKVPHCTQGWAARLNIITVVSWSAQLHYTLDGIQGKCVPVPYGRAPLIEPFQRSTLSSQRVLKCRNIDTESI